MERTADNKRRPAEMAPEQTAAKKLKAEKDEAEKNRLADQKAKEVKELQQILNELKERDSWEKVNLKAPCWTFFRRGKVNKKEVCCLLCADKTYAFYEMTPAMITSFDLAPTWPPAPAEIWQHDEPQRPSRQETCPPVG